jgi:hypothetical protein
LHLYTCVYILCTLFTLLHLSPPLFPSHWCQSPTPHRSCSALLFSYFVGEKTYKKKIKWETWYFARLR